MLRIEKEKALTFDDVLLIPAESSVLPRDVDLKTKITRDITLSIPLLSAAMDTVTESNMAIAMAQVGGLGIIHKNLSIEDQAKEVRKVKKYESGIVQDPVTVFPDCKVEEVKKITEAGNFSGVPVIDNNNKLVGIVTRRDMRFETNLDQPVKNIMTQQEKLVTIKEGADIQEAIALLHKHRLERILIVNDAFQLRGMITVTDILKAREKPYSSKDSRGHLLVGAAVGVDSESKNRVIALAASGVDVIIVDTAHGHSKSVIEQIKWIKCEFPDVQLIGGNIATASAAKALADAGVDGVKVGIGPGSICTTRIISGVGVPQVSAIGAASEALLNTGVSVIADGGIRYSGDICKAIAAGASAVMVGSLFAGTDESPGDIEIYHGRSFKGYRGMGSIGAMQKGSKDRYFQENETDSNKLVPEGIEGRVPYNGSVLNIVYQLIGGLRAGMGYTGSKNIEDLRTKSKFMMITGAGIRESHVHDVNITKEAPNYWMPNE